MANSPASSPGVMAQRPDAVSARIAPYTGRSSLILFGGLALILVNAVASYEGHAIIAAIDPIWPAPSSAQAHTSLLDLVAQAVMLGLLLLVASIDDEAGSFALLFLAALWLGWLLVNRAGIVALVGLLSGGKGTKTA